MIDILLILIVLFFIFRKKTQPFVNVYHNLDVAENTLNSVNQIYNQHCLDENKSINDGYLCNDLDEMIIILERELDTKKCN